VTNIRATKVHLKIHRDVNAIENLVKNAKSRYVRVAGKQAAKKRDQNLRLFANLAKKKKDNVIVNVLLLQ